MEFSISLVSRSPETRASLGGELDVATASEVSRRLQSEIHDGCRRMVLDLSSVTFVDASALGMLTTVRRLLIERQGTLELVGCSPAVLRLCHATGLAERLGLTSSGEIVPAG